MRIDVTYILNDLEKIFDYGSRVAVFRERGKTVLEMSGFKYGEIFTVREGVVEASGRDVLEVNRIVYENALHQLDMITERYNANRSS